MIQESDVALQEIEKIKNEFDTGKSFEEHP